ncbi:MAG: glycosyltransferase [Gemmatimonadaceae bacterium]
MHILWIKTELLHPVDKGGRIRTFQMLRQLRRDHRITYLALNDGSGPPDALDRAAEYCDDLVTLPFETRRKRSAGFYAELLANMASPLPYAIAKYRVPALTEALRDLVQRSAVDAAVCDFLAPSVNIPDGLGVPLILFQHNVEAQIWERHAANARDPVTRWYMRRQWRRMAAFERRECARFDHVVAVSQEDADLMRRLYAPRAISTVATGVDTEYFAPSGQRKRMPNEIVFTGSMDWLPNEDAMLWFTSAVLPLVREHVPEATLSIVGRTPSAPVRDLERRHSGVTVTGSVPDVRPYLEQGSVFVIPLRIGGGTRLKAYEAMGMEIPVVSTRIGVEGLPLAAGGEYLAADDAPAFAAAIVRLLREPALGRALAQAAAARVRRECGWREVAAVFADICSAAARRPAGVVGSLA